jgi:hypothetical protein
VPREISLRRLRLEPSGFTPSRASRGVTLALLPRRVKSSNLLGFGCKEFQFLAKKMRKRKKIRTRTHAGDFNNNYVVKAPLINSLKYLFIAGSGECGQ